MTYAERIEQLEQNLFETTRAAVSLMVGMAHAVAQTPAAREELAQGFEAGADLADGDPQAQRLARLVAAALRG